MAGKKPIPAHDVELGGGSGGGVRGSTIRPAPKGGGKAKKVQRGKKTFRQPSGMRTPANSGLSTPKSRALNKARWKVQERADKAAERGMKAEGKGKSSRVAVRDLKSGTKDFRTLSNKMMKAKKGKSFKLKTKEAADAKAKKVLREMAAKKGGAKVSTTPGKAGVIKPKRRAGKPGKVKGKVKSKAPYGYQAAERKASGKKPLNPYARGGSNKHKIKNRGPDPEGDPGYGSRDSPTDPYKGYTATKADKEMAISSRLSDDLRKATTLSGVRAAWGNAGFKINDE
tara:strand:+ start:4263 stop:5114 length:852 start_codon:yes stop_codon:yes gene_type:complete